MIDDRKLFDALLKHHVATEGDRTKGVPAYVSEKDRKKAEKLRKAEASGRRAVTTVGGGGNTGTKRW